MKFEIENHPALRLGKFLKLRRIDAGLTLRDAATWMEIKPSALSELERGIGHHMTPALCDEIIHCYRLDLDDSETLEDMMAVVARMEPLTIADIFDEDDVLPLFIPLNGKQRKQFLKTIGFKQIP